MDILKVPKKVVAYLEDTHIPLSYYFLAFFAALNLRNFLEIFSDTSSISFALFPASHKLFIPAYTGLIISFLHFTFFWIALFLSFPIIATLVTKENINKTLRTMLGFSWIIIITPIVDLILSRGRGIDITYITPQGILSVFPFPAALNPGEKVTVTISIILIFIYGLIKTKKTLKATLLAVLFYLVNSLSFMVPFIIVFLAKIFHKDPNVNSPLSIIPILAVMTVVESAIIFYLHNKKYCSSIVKNMGMLKTLHLILIFILGMLIFRAHVSVFIFENIGLFILSTLVITLGYAVYILLSHLEDKSIPQDAAKKISAVLFLFAAVIASCINVTTVFFLFSGLGCIFLYEVDPFRLKRLPIVSKVLLSFNLLLLVMLGWLFVGGEILNFPHIFTLYILIFFSGCLNLIDLKNKRLEKADIKTLPSLLGEKKSRMTVGALFLISYLVLPLLLLDKILILPCLLLGFLVLFLITRKNYQENPVFWVYLISLIGLIIWLNSLRILT